MLNRLRSSRGGESTSGTAASRLVSVFAEVFRLPQERVHPNLGPSDVERWDSVGHVMLVTAVEREFSIQFDVDEIMEFTSFLAMLSAIERRMAA
jgi:acyl carrier protein